MNDDLEWLISSLYLDLARQRDLAPLSVIDEIEAQIDFCTQVRAARIAATPQTMARLLAHPQAAAVIDMIEAQATSRARNAALAGLVDEVAGIAATLKARDHE